MPGFAWRMQKPEVMSRARKYPVGVVGARHAAGVRVGPPDRGCRG
jgi:hypothetical protein